MHTPTAKVLFINTLIIIISQNATKSKVHQCQWSWKRNNCYKSSSVSFFTFFLKIELRGKILPSTLTVRKAALRQLLLWQKAKNALLLFFLLSITLSTCPLLVFTTYSEDPEHSRPIPPSLPWSAQQELHHSKQDSPIWVFQC